MSSTKKNQAPTGSDSGEGYDHFVCTVIVCLVSWYITT